MGVVTWLQLHGLLSVHPVVAFSFLYALNMYFQSYGAVSINKVKAYWFHVRERGLFGAIFGVPISFGVYFAFDWSQSIVDATKVNNPATLTSFQSMLHSIFALEGATVDPTWLVFFIPAGILIFWALLDLWLIKDTPEQAGFGVFDVADASSDEMHIEFSTMDLIKKVFTNPIMLTICGVEFAAGVLRNGIMQWYLIFANETGFTGGDIFSKNWGLWLCFSGIFGSFAAGIISDKLFHSRRGPPAVGMNAMMFILMVVMSIYLYTAPIIVGISAVLVTFAVIGVHGLMSGAAAADFGGRKATATCSGIIDGFVYLGSGLQSFCLGYITSWNWSYWPIFLAPFALVGLFFSIKLWKQLPEATKRYLRDVENYGIDGQPAMAKAQISPELN
jgi:OPA family glycerol-3-phosphate transporter-like MFS transporter